MSINDSKRYYFLKLKKGFFQQHQIKILKSLNNGKISALIYMELLDESITHNGELRFSENLPYDIPTISAVIDESEEDVKLAIEQCVKLELIEILEDKTYKLHQLESMVGSETNASKRIREKRRLEREFGEQMANKKRTQSKQKSHKFIPPTIEEVEAYCKERNNGVDASKFVNFYSAKDWYIGKNKIKDWKACVRTWESKNKKGNDLPTYNTEDEISFDKDELERLLKERGKHANT